MYIRSERIRHLGPSTIRAMTDACTAQRGINLGQGLCNLPTPEFVRHAAASAIDAGVNTYAPARGDAHFRNQIAQKMRCYNGIDYDPDTEIVATVGTSGAITCTLQALTNPGDEIIVFEPSYGYHLHGCRLAGVDVRTLTLPAPAFPLDANALEDAITPKTRAILLNSPTNPSGKVFTREELENIAAVCIRHDLLCITDEVYEYIVYDGLPHISIAALPKMKERTVTISGFSKSFAITGWRVGFAAAPPPFAEAISLISDLYTICPPAPLQHAVGSALQALPNNHFPQFVAHCQSIRDQLCDTLEDAGLAPIRPQGAYYVLCDATRLAGDPAQTPAMRLLHEAGVAGIPGSAFYEGSEGDTFIRFCYATSSDTIDDACQRMRDWAHTR